jgi:hypothetical protein
MTARIAAILIGLVLAGCAYDGFTASHSQWLDTTYNKGWSQGQGNFAGDH